MVAGIFKENARKGKHAEREREREREEEEEKGNIRPASCNFSSLIRESSALRAVRYPRGRMEGCATKDWFN